MGENQSKGLLVKMIDVPPLKEYERILLPADSFPNEVGTFLWKNFDAKISVDFPSPKTGGQWQLTAQGWVGQIPVSEDLILEIRPKVPIANLFGMLEYAYNLKSFELLPNLVGLQSLRDFYETLAEILARRILDRSRKGIYRSYIHRSETLAYLRGRLDIRKISKPVVSPTFDCDFHQHTADIEDNAILAWALYKILMGGLCERTRPIIRQAHRKLQGLVKIREFPAAVCIGRHYSRLNEDYEVLHALCRFFLENTGPGYMLGDRSMMPFLIDMSRLFEAFVAEWTRRNLAEHLFLDAQHSVIIDETSNISFRIDLVIFDRRTGDVVCVLDTKYKPTKVPSTDDIAQITAYAESKNCRDAILVYPSSDITPLDRKVGSIRVRSLAFPLDGDLSAAGREFLQSALGSN